MKPPTIVGFDTAERTVTLQFAEDIRGRGFTIGAEFGCARNQTSTQFCHEAAENAHLLAKAREESAIRGLTLATICDTLLGEDATDRSDEALVRAARKLKQDIERFTGGGLLDCHAICDQRDNARAENHALREEIARLRDALWCAANNLECAADCDPDHWTDSQAREKAILGWAANARNAAIDAAKGGAK